MALLPSKNLWMTNSRICCIWSILQSSKRPMTIDWTLESYNFCHIITFKHFLQPSSDFPSLLFFSFMHHFRPSFSSWSVISSSLLQSTRGLFVVLPQPSEGHTTWEKAWSYSAEMSKALSTLLKVQSKSDLFNYREFLPIAINWRLINCFWKRSDFDFQLNLS